MTVIHCLSKYVLSDSLVIVLSVFKTSLGGRERFSVFPFGIMRCKKEE